MADEPLIRLRGITKRFPGVVAVRDVDLDISPGSCHGLCGENGAGKSTLGKIIAGIYRPDSGTVFLNGQAVRFSGARDALLAGIGIVHQELSFCENMTVAENLALGQFPSYGPFVARRRLHELAVKRLDAIGASIDPRTRVADLTISQQQMVQIAAAVSRGARVLIFDEPTSSLSGVETVLLFDLIGRLRASGTTAIYVSHRLEEVFHLCDVVSVLRDGQIIATKSTADWTERNLVQTMIGRPLETYFPQHLSRQPGPQLLEVRNFTSPGKFADVSFSLREGEILGLAGLVGAGRTELSEAIFGLDRRASGTVVIAGEEVKIRSPRAAMNHGIGLVPEDRKRHGLVLLMKAGENITLPRLPSLARLGWVNSSEEQKVVRSFFDRLQVRAPSPNVVTAGLSGGNQQKIVLAKWLATQCRILVVDEPTRGVDVGAKAEIHSFLDQLAQKGTGIILISSELPEMLNLSTRIIVLRNGSVAGELSRDEANQESVIRLMAGIPAKAAV